MKKLYAIASAVLALTLMAVPIPAKAWYSYHCVRVWHPPVVHPCCCCCCHHHWSHASAYPTVFVEGGHVYVPPTYYYSSRTVVDTVLVNHSIEIGPVVPVVVKPAATIVVNIL